MVQGFDGELHLHSVTLVATSKYFIYFKEASDMVWKLRGPESPVCPGQFDLLEFFFCMIIHCASFHSQKYLGLDNDMVALPITSCSLLSAV